MAQTWSWEEMDYIGEEELRLLPDLWIEPPEGTCKYCGLTEKASGKRLAVECSVCGGVAHFLCAVDCSPDPFESDEEENDFVCGKCLHWTPEDAAQHAASTELANVAASTSSVPDDDFDPFFD